MKKLLITSLLAATSMFFVSCEKERETIYVGKGRGYSGEVKVEVIQNKDSIKDIKLVSHKETPHIMDRAFPILRERILKAQSPVVDSVSAATYTSTAVKRAVAEAMKAQGKDVPEITMKTKAPEQPVAYLEPVDTDLVIVGGGPSGLAAAISAREAGVKNIILVEKLDMLSGNGKFDMDFVNLTNSEAMKKAGIEDTKEKFISDNSSPLDTPERMNAFAEGSWKLDTWLRGMGIQLNHVFGKRVHMTEADQYAGAHIQDNLEKKVKELGIDVRTNTRGLDLIMKDGVATGIKVQNGNNFYDINAKAVIIATGGFSANPDFLAKYAPGMEEFETSNQMGATGDFIPVFEKNNIALANLDVINLFPFTVVSTRDLTGGGDGFMLINNKGERFTTEGITYATRLQAANKMAAQPNGVVFYVYDEVLYNSFYRLQKHAGMGLHTKVENLEELAEKMGVPFETLKKTRDDFNAAIRGEIKDQFREKPFTREISSEGPYYFVSVQPAVHMTRGGVVADEFTQVIDNAGNVVEGLYAAGEVTSTNAAYSAAVIFGRLAGERAAEFISGK